MVFLIKNGVLAIFEMLCLANEFCQVNALERENGNSWPLGCNASSAKQRWRSAWLVANLGVGVALQRSGLVFFEVSFGCF